MIGDLSSLSLRFHGAVWCPGDEEMIHGSRRYCSFKKWALVSHLDGLPTHSKLTKHTYDICVIPKPDLLSSALPLHTNHRDISPNLFSWRKSHIQVMNLAWSGSDSRVFEMRPEAQREKQHGRMKVGHLGLLFKEIRKHLKNVASMFWGSNCCLLGTLFGLKTGGGDGEGSHDKGV